MNDTGFQAEIENVNHLGLARADINWNLEPAELIELTLQREQGTLTNTGALAIDTGEFTGRSPKDRFIVEDEITRETVDWGEINQPFAPENFDKLYNKVIGYLNGRDIFARDCYACSNKNYRLNVRVITEFPWQNLFAYNMFIRPKRADLATFEPDWTVISAPGLHANADEDGTRQHNFSIINFTKKVILIGGTAYTGEIKKGIFSVLNFELPTNHNVLPMHCSANVGQAEDTAVFFGLSGTGKTTLSTDANRRLIGDDEHGWSSGNVFNFEGGCYAKTIDLSAKKEPEIFNAIRFGAMVENIGYHENTRQIDYHDSSITENTRVSYPLYHIRHVHSQIGGVPKNVFFLTCDAFGVLPPISKLTKAQAMYHFISGYTAKVAGTEEGITDPKATFSACFGAPFMPLHPTEYAEMLGHKLDENPNLNVWLVNTGWTGGAFGVGKRMALPHTRATIDAALSGVLNNVAYTTDDIFNLHIPSKCPGVRSQMLNPENTWSDKAAFRQTALKLARLFNDNFKQFEDQASAEILAAAPKVG